MRQPDPGLDGANHGLQGILNLHSPCLRKKIQQDVHVKLFLLHKYIADMFTVSVSHIANPLDSLQNLAVHAAKMIIKNLYCNKSSGHDIHSPLWL